MSMAVAEPTQLADISQKLDALTQQVAALSDQVQYLRERAYEQYRRQQERDELMEDLTPISRELFSVVVEQLEEIQSYVQLEDILFLLKRLARNTRTFNEMLDQLESLQDFVKDASPLTKDMFDQAVYTLNELEEKGYFGFARQGAYVVDQIVTSFSEEDVRQLGDNVVVILNAVKAMTQPEIMNLVANLTTAFQEVEEHAEELPTDLWSLIRQMRDPHVRRGLAITLAVFQRISQQQEEAHRETQRRTQQG